MPSMNIVFISIQSIDAKNMFIPANIMKENDEINVNLFSKDYESIDEDPILYSELVSKTKDADFIYIRTMADVSVFKKFEKYKEVLNNVKGHVFLCSSNIDITIMYRSLFKGSDEDYVLLKKYSLNRGKENEYGIFQWVANKKGLLNKELPEPVKQREEGIYHPDFPRDISLKDYLPNLNENLPTVGLMFPSNYWLYNNTDHIDMLIRTLESKDMNVIPIFFSIAPYNDGENKGALSTVYNYCTKKGSPIIDVILLNSPFSQLISSRDSNGMMTKDEENFYKTLTNVPVIQAMSISGEYRDYEEDPIGLGKHDIAKQATWAEVDGQIIGVPISYTPRTVGGKRTMPIPERIDHISELVKNWAKFRNTPPSDRKIAILLYQSRSDSGNIGTASGLDTIESVLEMLNGFKKMGYTVLNIPSSGKELVQEMLDGVTNDLNWTASEKIFKKAVDLVDIDRYKVHYEKIPNFNRSAIENSWGLPPGNVATDNGKMIIPGMIKGNIFIGYQPLRGRDVDSESIHDSMLPPPHQYLEFYRWLKHDFNANAVVHMGTHGSLEWLPGKNAGLSGKCYPDMILDALPNVYPFIIDDPGEGIQTRRRSESVVIGHLNPTLARVGSYDEIEEVENALQEYLKLRTTQSNERKNALASGVYDVVKKHNLFNDLKISDTGPVDFEEHIMRVHDYISEIKDAFVRSDLHVLGRAPAGHHFKEAIYSLTRLKNGDIPSLRESYANCIGLDLNSLLDSPSNYYKDNVLNSEIIEKIDSDVQDIISYICDNDSDSHSAILYTSEYCEPDENILKVLEYICNSLILNLKRTTDELDNMMSAFNGEYVLPGPSGAPTRGNAHILPMGRNYYGIDPETIPNPSSWIIGKKMADLMIERYVNERGAYPKQIGFIIWATDTMKTGGDDIGYILWLMGVRPVWNNAGRVSDLEVVPLEELKRPRIDVTVNITGLFRDVFPNIIDLIDKAVCMISELDETDEENYLLSNLRTEIIEGISNGIHPDEVRKQSLIRIFGAPPGGYGTGISNTIKNSDWETTKDLADIYISWCGHGYSREVHGIEMKDKFVKRFKNVDITVKNVPDREIDIFDTDDLYSYLGAMNTLVKAYGNSNAMSIVGDGSNPDRLKVREVSEECRFVFRSKVMNPKYIDGLKEHGYRGAAELASVTEFVFAWDATSNAIDDWMYDEMMERFLVDDKTRQWMKEVNPFAMMSIANRLQEAINRGLWNASTEKEEYLKDMFIEAEEIIEGLTDQ